MRLVRALLLWLAAGLMLIKRLLRCRVGHGNPVVVRALV
jgi:hypothetical protein